MARSCVSPVVASTMTTRWMVVPPNRPMVRVCTGHIHHGWPSVVDLERLLVEHVERIAQLHVTVDVAHERLGLRVVDGAVAQLDDLGVLRGHVHQGVRRDAALAVREPLKQVGVASGLTRTGAL